MTTPVDAAISKSAASTLVAFWPTVRIVYVNSAPASTSEALTSFAAVAMDVFSAKSALAVESKTGASLTLTT